MLEAPTGAGKTTRVPPALARAVAEGRFGEEVSGRIVVSEPRRLAARAAARRMARENGWRAGREVGWQVRFDRNWTDDSRIVVVTEGILVQWLQGDPFLEGVAVVVFDEIHERSLHLDLALAMARRVQREVRPELRLVAMSATLDPGPIAHFLGSASGEDGEPAPRIESRGRLHPLEVSYQPDTPDRSRRAIAGRVARGVRRLLEDGRSRGPAEGDVLVFLPGVGEIRATEEELSDLGRRGFDVQPLYGSLPPERQDSVLSPSPGRRRVVLATNVAESSVTVPGVRAVVDTGLVRRLTFDPSSGLDRLVLGRVSRASADQRAGRAGREAPGTVLRLWGEHDHAALPERETPEVLRVDLAGPALQLLAWGEADLESFGWFEAPPPEALATARRLLERLGAVGEHGVTAEGRRLARLPVHPRLGRLLSEGHRLGATREAALAAALLSERDPFAGHRGDHPPPPSWSDLDDRVEALEAFAAGRRVGGALGERLRPGAARFVLRGAKQLEGLAHRHLDDEDPETSPADPREALGRALLAAFPDRLCRRRQEGSRQGVRVGGGGVVLGRQSAVARPQLFLALDLDAGRPGVHADALVRLAAGVEESWLPADRVRTTTAVEFDPERRRAVAWRRRSFDDPELEDLVLEEKPVPAPAGAAAEALARAAAEDPAAALPLDDQTVASFLARLRSLAHWRPDLELPTFEGEDLTHLLPLLAAGKRSFDDFRPGPLLDAMKGTLSYQQLQALERWAPERLRVPSGSHIRLRYQPGEPPVLAVRIQEVFGLQDTPKVAGGRVPVLLHLLAPNFRPQQVTRDLAGFWERTYPEVRKELAGRYPKHAWPEDPLTAEATRRTRRR